jgi:hypothetical protein
MPAKPARRLLFILVAVAQLIQPATAETPNGAVYKTIKPGKAAKRKVRQMTETIEDCTVDQRGRESCHVIATVEVPLPANGQVNESTVTISEAEAMYKKSEADHQQMLAEMELENQRRQADLQQEAKQLKAQSQTAVTQVGQAVSIAQPAAKATTVDEILNQFADQLVGRKAVAAENSCITDVGRCAVPSIDKYPGFSPVAAVQNQCSFTIEACIKQKNYDGSMMNANCDILKPGDAVKYSITKPDPAYWNNFQFSAVGSNKTEIDKPCRENATSYQANIKALPSQASTKTAADSSNDNLAGQKNSAKKPEYIFKEVAVAGRWKDCEYEKSIAISWAKRVRDNYANELCNGDDGWRFDRIKFEGYEQTIACKDGKSWKAEITQGIAVCKKLQ